ncbi:beta-galactosidase [Streptomyces sp. NBC_00094]|uniref:beta-galactosidase n=1 Tax=Streptomyces sp. NBC_00094 TaxID=2903620 RepID=UPI0022529A61|nr:beta-galactosidase [Streptomyces sp. NBC_00094]MCX5394436.1 beta-galactosidase [Streptomyces sp. NBC_00094]
MTPYDNGARDARRHTTRDSRNSTGADMDIRTDNGDNSDNGHSGAGRPGPNRRAVLRLLGAGAVALAAGPVLGGLIWPSRAYAATGVAGTPLTLTNVRSGCRLDVYGGAQGDGAEIIQWTATGGPNQEWTPVEQGDGWVTITSMNSGKVLDVADGRTDDGARVIQWYANGAANQQWQLVDAGQGRVRIVGRASGKLLSVVDSSASAGAAIEIRSDTGDPSQLWTASVAPYRLDAMATEARPDTPLANAGAVAGGVAYGVTRNGWSRDGAPWYPVSGEFHYVRHPAQHWERELGRMRAGGVGIVATYVFWNHHEQTEGTWDWTGRKDLRAFMAAAQRQGMLVWLRVGPYINAEATDGGIPSHALSGSRSDDAGYLAKVDTYFARIAAQLGGMWAKDGGPIVGIQLENEFASGDPAHITTLRQMCTDHGMVVPYYTVTANSRFDKDTAIPLQGAYTYRGWEYGAGTSATSGFIYGTDEWTANTDIGGALYDTLDYPRGFCELGTGSPMRGNDRFLVERRYVAAHAYDSVGRGANYLGYYMFHGGTQEPGLSAGWPLTYDFQAPLGEFGRTRDSYRHYRRLHTFVTTCADELVRTRIARDPGQIMDPTQTRRLRYIGRFDTAGRGYVFVNNTQRNAVLPTRSDVQIRVDTAGGTVTLPATPLTMPADRCNVFPVMTDLNGVDLRWATVEPLAKLAGDSVPTWVYWAPDWTDRALAFDSATVVTGELGTLTQTVTGNERVVTLPAGQRTSLLVRAAGATAPAARIIVLTEAESLSAVVAPLDGRDRLVLTGTATLTGVQPTVRFSAPAGSKITADVFPAAGLAPATGWKAAQATAPFTRYTYQLATGPAAPRVTSLGAGRWRISSSASTLAGLAEARLVLDYRGGDATLIGAGTPLTNDLYHGETWSIDLRYLDDAARADLVLEVSAWDDAIRGVARPSGTVPGLPSWTWEPQREAAWR